ncbi:MAG TPA: type IV toxin-antitoxin system AbiEi family antitoxin domain-containing protein [Streptosporangiaceae bacterium]|nr:type IV toxin-antitoxin system AbiEi family antitoxin domain-containing protein [Streptosporangiaceae bacterium]
MTTKERRGRAAPERLAASQYGVITRAEAKLCGLTPRMLEHRIRPAGPWQRLLPGVYLTQSGEPSRDQLLMAALRYAGDGSMVTGLAALRRHEISVPATQVVDVLVPHARRRSSRGFVVVHRTIRLPQTYWADGPIKYAPPARAVADAVPRLDRFDDVRAIAAGAVQKGLCTVADLATELALGPRREAGVLRAVLGEVADGIRSPAEGDFRGLVRRGGLPVPLFNARLYLGQQLLAVPDAWWPQAGVAAEVDSREWHFSPDAWEQTMLRHARMTAAGVLVLHFSPRQVRTAPGEVIAVIAAALRAGRPIPAILTRPAGGDELRAAS